MSGSLFRPPHLTRVCSDIRWTSTARLSLPQPAVVLNVRLSCCQAARLLDHDLIYDTLQPL